MAEQYPDITELYSIGTTWQERDLWCLEITNEKIPTEEKTGIGVFANIHGGERESAASAMYTAWWLTLCSDDAYVKGLLDAYTIYVILVINPDGYEQSFVINTRPNLRPQDANGNNIPFSDPYADLDGDGFIATLYRGKADDTPSRELPIFGMESPDWDENGVLGDDPRNSGIDMNRTFDYQWNRYDIETKDTQQVGNVNWTSAGTAPATEPEIRALQQFLYTHELGALVSLHTGIQCVLYPWCYRCLLYTSLQRDLFLFEPRLVLVIRPPFDVRRRIARLKFRVRQRLKGLAPVEAVIGFSVVGIDVGHERSILAGDLIAGVHAAVNKLAERLLFQDVHAGDRALRVAPDVQIAAVFGGFIRVDAAIVVVDHGDGLAVIVPVRAPIGDPGSAVFVAGLQRLAALDGFRAARNGGVLLRDRAGRLLLGGGKDRHRSGDECRRQKQRQKRDFFRFHNGSDPFFDRGPAEVIAKRCKTASLRLHADQHARIRLSLIHI